MIAINKMMNLNLAIFSILMQSSSERTNTVKFTKTLSFLFLRRSLKINDKRYTEDQLIFLNH